MLCITMRFNEYIACNNMLILGKKTISLISTVTYVVRRNRKALGGGSWHNEDFIFLNPSSTMPLALCMPGRLGTGLVVCQKWQNEALNPHMVFTSCFWGPWPSFSVLKQVNYHFWKLPDCRSLLALIYIRKLSGFVSSLFFRVGLQFVWFILQTMLEIDIWFLNWPKLPAPVVCKFKSNPARQTDFQISKSHTSASDSVFPLPSTCYRKFLTIQSSSSCLGE